ncbi:MAG: AMP-binding protein [Nitrospira sp.]|nr:AMP-binding protein [Nitrospira sp.]
MSSFSTLQALVRSFGNRGTRPALISFKRAGPEILTYGDLAATVGRLSTGFRRQGMNPGSMVALCAPNTAEWVIIACALMECGAVPVPVDTQLEADDLRHVLEDGDVKWIVTTRSLAKRLEEIGLSHDVSRIMIDTEPTDERSWTRWMVEPGPAAPPVDESDPAVLFYTSGTTGLPKGVCLSHRNVSANLHGLLRLGIVKPNDRILIPLPLHHVYPFVVGMLASLAAGVPIILPFSPTGPQLARALVEGEATVLIGVPRLYHVLVTSIIRKVRQKGTTAWLVFQAATRLSVVLRRWLGLRLGRRLFASLHREMGPNLRLLVSGGAALGSDFGWTLEGLGWQVASGYGLTETSPIVTFNEPGTGRIGSAGRPLEGVEVQLAESESGEPGEVLVRGPNVFAGYRNLPDKTNEAFTSDGFFRTGDRGHFDDGYLMLTGRVGSLIKLGAGEKIQPERIEEVIGTSEHIKEVGVLQDQDVLGALVVPHEQLARETDMEQLRKRCEKEIRRASAGLPSHQRVTAVAVTRTPLPRTRLGKLRRHKLLERFRAAREHPQAESEATGPVSSEQLSPEDRQLLGIPHVGRVWEWFGKRFSDRRVSPESHIRFDLGIESMDWIALTLALHEQTGVEISQEAIGRVETIRDLLREVAEAQGDESITGMDPVERLEHPEDLIGLEQRRWLAARHVVHRAVAAGLYGLSRMLMRWRYRLRVIGRAHVPDRGPFLMISNHVSFLDSLAIAAALPSDLLQQTYWSGWSAIMFRNMIMRWLSRAMQIVPIDPRSGPLTNVAFGVCLLRRGHPLVWFPEGERSRDGRLQPFQSGLGMLLAAEPVPIVPIWIHGTYEAMPIGARWPRPSRVTVVFGEPIAAKSVDSQAPGMERYEQIAQALHDRVARLARTQSLE